MKNDNQIIWILVVIGTVLLVSLFSMGGFWMMGGHYGGMMGNYLGMGSYFGMGSFWLFGWIFMILIVVALVLFIIWMIKQIQEPKRKR